jgi:hypothetical protein
LAGFILFTTGADKLDYFTDAAVSFVLITLTLAILLLMVGMVFRNIRKVCPI